MIKFFDKAHNMNENLPNDEKPITKPIAPEDWECCENGCQEMCVYEIYRVQKQAYDEQQKRLAKMLEPID